jgi:hypothetical protein
MTDDLVVQRLGKRATHQCIPKERCCRCLHHVAGFGVVLTASILDSPFSTGNRLLTWRASSSVPPLSTVADACPADDCSSLTACPSASPSPSSSGDDATRPVERRTEGPVAVVMEFATLPERARSSIRRTAILYAADDPSSLLEAGPVTLSGTSNVAARLLRGHQLRG